MIADGGSSDGGKKSKAVDELDQVTGSAEDEFADDLAVIREHELLYGTKSLLTAFGPFIQTICMSNVSFDVS